MSSQDKAAELLAAVRAVESGERPAASFFAEPGPASAGHARRTPGAARPAPGGPDAGSAGPGGSGGSGAPAAVPGVVPAVLAEGGAPESLAGKVVSALGPGAAAVLRADPWQLLAVAEVQPEQADGFARALLGAKCGPGDARRVEALVVRLLERAALLGHTVQEPAALARGLAQYSVPEPEEALRAAIDAGVVLVFEDSLDAPGSPAAPGGAGPAGAAEAGAAGIGSAGTGAAGTGEAGDAETERPVRLLLGLEHHALAEESLADGLTRLISTFAPAVTRSEPGGPASAGSRLSPEESAGESGDASPPQTASTSVGWEGAAAGAPSPSAAELLRAVAAHGLVTHTGGEAARAEPAAVVAAATAMGLRAYAATHTEDGRQRVARLIADARADGTAPGAGVDPAVTVAGLLSGREGPGHDEEGLYALDLLVLMDAPQLDAESAAALVESVPDGARLVLSGDPLLLASAGPGRVFTDLLAARACPQVVSRTPDPGPIGELVSGIGIGELNQVAAPGKEVVIVPVREAAEAVHRAVQLVADSVPRAIGVPVAGTQVITPGHGGAAGTRALNAALKERLNPGPGRFDGFDPGDRVAHSPAPGRTALGTVVSAEEEGLRLECAGEPILVPRERLAGTVRHGWAVTAHQAAGMRWPAAVVVLPGDATGALSREWVYTAFGLGLRHLSVVHGAGEALPHAVAAVPAPARTTRLRTLLAQTARTAVTEPGNGL